MLKPGGQLFFSAFVRTFKDEAYDKLDKGTWSKYNNSKYKSPFHYSADPKKYYDKLISSLRYDECHLSLEVIQVPFSEKSLEGNVI